MGRIDRVKTAVRLKDYAEDTLETAHGGYVCPNCKSGTGPNGTPAFSVRGERWKCFACDAGGDVIDLAKIIEGTADTNAACSALESWAGIGSDAVAVTSPSIGQRKNAVGGHQATQEAREAETRTDTAGRADAAEMTRYRDAERAYIEKARERIEDAREYIEARGFTVEQARAWGWGFDPDAGGAKDASGEWCKRGRVVIPFPGSDCYHIDRATAPGAKAGKYNKPAAERVGGQPLWWPERAKDADAVFLVEGPLDALALEAEGVAAVAACGTATENAVREIKARGFAGCVVVATDPDEAGERAYAAASAALEAADMPFTRLEWPADGEAKLDACELRRVRPDEFRELVGEAESEAAAIGYGFKAEARAKYLAQLKIIDPQSVALDLYEGKEAKPPTPTGFGAFDKVLGGGMIDGQLYAFGGGSSVGKTSFMLQIADHIAESGRDVLFVTIEQSARELVAKSLSRLASAECAQYGSVTAGDIANPERRAGWSLPMLDAFDRACVAYRDSVCPRMHYIEAEGSPTVANIERAAKAIGASAAEPPVIMIDYLQLLAAPNDRSSDKQSIDENVKQLRQLARDVGTPVMVISSLNRTAYYMPVDMPSFKESGSIEYSADVLFGIQPRDLEKKLDDFGEFEAKKHGKKIFRKMKHSKTRRLEIPIIKNRSGETTDDAIPCDFNAAKNVFSFDVRE